MSFFRNLFQSERRAAERDLERRLDILRAEIRAAREAGDLPALTQVRERLGALRLTEDDAELELEMAAGVLEVAALQDGLTRGEDLPEVFTTHRAVGSERCHFLAPAWRPDVAGDGGGKLLFTPQRLLYLGTASATLSWAHVAKVEDEGRDIVVRARPDRLLAFRCNSYVDTLRGAWIARQLVCSKRTSPSR